MAKHIWHTFTLAVTLALAAQAQPADCNASAPSPSVTVALPSRPFSVAPTQDGCWVFVSLTAPSPGIAILKRSAGKIQLVRVTPLPSAPAGITMTHDGKLVIAAAGNAAIFVDVQKMIDGAADPVAGSISGGRGSVYANTTADDGLLFVSEENGASITVIDLPRARANGYKADAIIGQIPAGDAPIALTFSPDGKWLYTTSELALPAWNWPKACKQEGAPAGTPIVNPEGAVIVVDVARAKTDPAQAVVARVPAGCSAVRMSISPKGDRIYVTARNNNGVLEFDTSKLVSDGAHALVGIAPVGEAPVPVMSVDQGRKIVVGNSNRFAGGDSGESLVVLDNAKMSQGLAAVMGTIPAGSFPREMAVSADGRTLFLTNFASNSLQVMDIAHLPIDPKLPPEIAKNADALTHRHDNKTVTVDPKVLSRYTGVYQGANGQALAIDMSGNDLTLTAAPNPMMTAQPESDTRFYTPLGEIEFPAVAEGGHAAQLTLIRGQNAMAYGRLDEEAAKAVRDAAAAFEKRMRDNTPAPGSEEALRQLIVGVQSGKPIDNLLGPGAQQFLPQFQQQAAQMGPVKSIRFQAVGPAGPDIYEVEGEKGTWVCRIWLTADGKVDRVIAQQPQANMVSGPPQVTQKAVAGDASFAAAAAEDTKNAGIASGYVTDLAGAGDQGATRLAASRAAGAADTAAAAAETAAAAVETDASKATAASAAGDRAAMNTARDKATSDYSALLAADAALAKVATDLAAASAGNVAFYGGATSGAGAINDMGAQDASAAANLLSAVTKGGTAAYSAAAANEAAAIKDANTIADMSPPRAPAFQAAAKAEAEAQSAAAAAAAGGSASAAAAAVLAAAAAGATADGGGNPYAGAVEIGAAAIAHAVSATIASQQAVDRLKALH